MTRSVKAVALVLLTTLLVAAAVIVPTAPSVSAQDDPDYRPCDPGSDVDLLVLMDQSGSLQTSDPKDRRSDALEAVMSSFAGVMMQGPWGRLSHPTGRMGGNKAGAASRTARYGVGCPMSTWR